MTKVTEREHPWTSASVLSKITFTWILPLFRIGKERDIRAEDLCEPLPHFKSSHLANKAEQKWQEERSKAKPSFLKSMLKVHLAELAGLGLIVLVNDIILKIAQPILLGLLIEYLSPGSVVSYDGALLAALGFVLCSILCVVCIHPLMFRAALIGLRVRTASSAMLYRKVLKLSKGVLAKVTMGKAVNLLSNDVSKFDGLFFYIHYLWAAPVQSVIVTYLLWGLIGPASILGLLFIILLIPVQAWFGQMSAKLRLETAVRTDKRLRFMNEILKGIQIIKMYTWEDPFAKMVATARKDEMSYILKQSYIKSAMLSLVNFHTRFCIFVSIMAYLFFGNDTVTAHKVYMVVSFFNTIRMSVTIYFPLAFIQLNEGRASAERVQEFLMYEDLPGSDETNTASLNPRVSMKDATAQWSPEVSDSTLRQISLDASPGRLVALIGPVGSGKSSLFHALLKELPLSDGSIDVQGSISYASQDPWLFSGSVRQNILLYEAFDRERYQTVIRVCGLEQDLDELPNGDKTLVGDRGIALSGGQKARVNLARAVYKESDIYLLDDPLSAVDTHVGRQLFEECITGFLRSKIVLLATHQIQYLANADNVLLLENGAIKAKGTYEELARSGEAFSSLLQSVSEDNRDDAAIQSSTAFRRLSVTSAISKKEVDEDRTSGVVGSRTYLTYFLAGGGWVMVNLTFWLGVLGQVLISFSDFWINFWVSQEELSSRKVTDVMDRETCLAIWTGLIVAIVISSFVRSLIFFYACIRASRKLHDSMFVSISRATMSFFNNNPSGRILNRFSNDIGKIDESLPAVLVDCFQIALILIGIFALVSIMDPWLLIPAVVIAGGFYYLRNFYLATSRSMMRLEGVTKSPVFSHLSSSLQGLATIRASNAQAESRTEFENLLDVNSTAWYLLESCSRSFGYWLDMGCVAYIVIVVFTFLHLDLGFGGNMGLAITQSIGLTDMFQWCMRQSAELENRMTSVERVLDYTDLESEPALESPADKKPPQSWPERGRLVFEKVFLSYTDGWVLKGVSFEILPKEKVGIVGRTGAGKSSLVSALFRLYDVHGTIFLDGIDVSKIGLHELRSKISIIPQEPVLFSGTLRYNLDPFEEYNDDALWLALEEVELKQVVADLSESLSCSIREGGANLSVGQRQLICLARAILRNNKVLIMDEATANVDPQTDALIQRTIRRKFADCTVLTIAHRLHTIIDSDRVIVMDTGSVAEEGHPFDLLKNSDGLFCRMVEQTGKSSAEVLHSAAEKSFMERRGLGAQQADEFIEK